MTDPVHQERWDGGWVAEHLGVELVGRGVASAGGDEAVEELVGLALRRNPKRAHLVVSHVLAKHVPVAPGRARAAADLLGAEVVHALDGAVPSVVLGYAETATGLGHLVADHLAAPYLHSTRRPGRSALSFEEEHSHATTHRLLPRDPALLTGDGPLVLVDDELTTGTTALNTIAELHALHPREQYVVAALLDLRPPDRLDVGATEARLGTSITVVSLLAGEVRTMRERDDLVGEAIASFLPTVPRRDPPAVVLDLDGSGWAWDPTVPEGGRHGFDPADRPRLEREVATLADAMRAGLEGEAGLAGAARVHVLGSEELMYLPLALAEALEPRLPGAAVTVSTTTRSPVVVLDDPSYAIRHGLTFAAHDTPPGEHDATPRFAYNLEPGRFDAIVLVLDDATPVGGATDLLDRLRALCRLLVVVRVPAARLEGA